MTAVAISGVLDATVFAVLPGFSASLGLALFRISGVDFRQWFQRASELREVADTSWIGQVRFVTLAFGSGAALLLLIALFVSPSLRIFGDNSFEALAGSDRFWLPVLGDSIGVAIGAAGGQLVASIAWQAGLSVVTPPRAPIPIEPRPAAGRPDPSSSRRRLVLFCDGTWNWPDATRETNVARLLRAVIPVTSAGVQQITFYHQGVGTGNIVDRIVGGGAGVGIANSVKACYGFLADNYVPGDEIFLFGFSRGAYVARSVSGLVGKIGILSKVGMANFIEAWNWYTDTEAEHLRHADTLDKIAADRSTNVPIRCIGVWDTVGALGIPGSRFCARSFAFHSTALGEHVQYAFQALALSERRGNFQAAIMVPHIHPDAGQLLEQVWFPGAHSNIGGGYPEHKLSDTALVWMVSRLRRHGLLDIAPAAIAAAQYQRPDVTAGKVIDSRKGFWSYAFCPVPRPVGLVSATERIHESAWDRTSDDAKTLPSDPYRKETRRNWLAAMVSLKNVRDSWEVAPDLQPQDLPQAGLHPSAPPVLRKLGICDRIMQWLGGSG